MAVLWPAVHFAGVVRAAGEVHEVVVVVDREDHVRAPAEHLADDVAELLVAREPRVGETDHLEREARPRLREPLLEPAREARLARLLQLAPGARPAEEDRAPRAG